MKKRILVLLILMGMLLALLPAEALADSSYDKVLEGTQENSWVSAYIAAARTAYADSPVTADSIVTSYSASVSGVRKDWPASFTAEISNSQAKTMTITDFARNRTREVTVAAGVQEIYNISPAGGEITVRDKSGNVLETWLVQPTKGEVRMIRTSSSAEKANNIRDLGGWPVYNSSGEQTGTVKYGYIYRGAEIIDMGDADRLLFTDYLGITAEIDLATSESESSLGSGVEYVPCSFNFKNSYNSVVLTGTKYSKVKKAVEAIMDTVLNDGTAFFHCMAGADRTGVVAYIIEALLGMNETDMAIDYELTSFSKQGTRDKNSNLAEMITYLESLSDSGTICDGAVAWCISAGISSDKINRFREKMIDTSDTSSDKTPEQETDAAGLSIDCVYEETEVGDTFVLHAAADPDDLTDNIIWAVSSDCLRVEADSGTAVVTGVSDGIATVTASVGKWTESCTVVIGSGGGYTLLDFVSLNGAQYIDTGVIPDAASFKAEDRYRSCYTGTSTTCPYLLGESHYKQNEDGSQSDTIEYLYLQGASFQDYVCEGTMAGSFFSDVDTAGIHSHSAELLNGVLTSTLDGQSTSGSYTYDSTGAGTILIGNVNHYSGTAILDDYYKNADLFYLRLYNSGTLVRDYVPVMNSAGAVGLYDTVNRTFQESASDTAFTAGPVKTVSFSALRSDDKKTVTITADYLPAGSCTVLAAEYICGKMIRVQECSFESSSGTALFTADADTEVKCFLLSDVSVPLAEPFILP